MRSFVSLGCTGFLICGVIGVVGCGGDDTGAQGNSGVSPAGSGGTNGTAGSTSSGGSGGTATGSGGSASGSGGSSGSSAGNGGSSQPDSGAGSGDAKTDTGTASDASTGYNPCPPKGGAADGGTVPCSIMALGDSITDGAGGTLGGSYRPPLFHLALSHQQTITFVGGSMNGPNMVDGVTFPKGHEGHSGFTIDDGGGRTGIHNLTTPAMNMYHPNIITLMIGTNDTDIMLDLPNAPMRLGGLMDTILTNDPKVLLVVAQIVPTKDDNENIRVKAYNDAIPALVKARADAGKHVIMVDMYGGFQADANYKTDYMNDNLHPKDPGYVKMGDIWYAAIGPLFR